MSEITEDFERLSKGVYRLGDSLYKVFFKLPPVVKKSFDNAFSSSKIEPAGFVDEVKVSQTAFESIFDNPIKDLINPVELPKNVEATETSYMSMKALNAFDGLRVSKINEMYEEVPVSEEKISKFEDRLIDVENRFMKELMEKIKEDVEEINAKDALYIEKVTETTRVIIEKALDIYKEHLDEIEASEDSLWFKAYLEEIEKQLNNAVSAEVLNESISFIAGALGLALWRNSLYGETSTLIEGGEGNTVYYPREVAEEITEVVAEAQVALGQTAKFLKDFARLYKKEKEWIQKQIMDQLEAVEKYVTEDSKDLYAEVRELGNNLKWFEDGIYRKSLRKIRELAGNVYVPLDFQQEERDTEGNFSEEDLSKVDVKQVLIAMRNFYSSIEEEVSDAAGKELDDIETIGKYTEMCAEEILNRQEVYHRAKEDNVDGIVFLIDLYNTARKHSEAFINELDERYKLGLDEKKREELLDHVYKRARDHLLESVKATYVDVILDGIAAAIQKEYDKTRERIMRENEEYNFL